MTQREPPLLPWDNHELERLLRDIIAHGSEAQKIDFKSEIEAGSNEQNADLLKDITAIANTYASLYKDHGFLIYGVKGKEIVGIVKTETNSDKLLNHIEQLLRAYISPLPLVYVIGFEEEPAKKWGVVVIPPRDSKPYMFFKDLQCADRTRTRRRGEWFVRQGSRTDIGLPEDLAVITQRQTDGLLEPLRESVRNLQIRLAKTEEQYDGALFKLVAQTASGLPATSDRETLGRREALGDELGEALGMDLATRFKQRLRTPKDALAEDLFAEARTLRDSLRCHHRINLTFDANVPMLFSCSRLMP